VPQTSSPREAGASRARQILLFGRNFLKHPKMLGSLIPSSRFLVNRLLDQVDWRHARVIVEYGPGVGTITTEILRRLRPDGRLIAIETNADFVAFLRRTVADGRLHVVHGSAAEADAALGRLGLRHADYVISGIPYTTIPPDVRTRILHKTHDVLHPQGAFLVYQFTRTVLRDLERVFGHVRQDFEPRNVMPARLFYCRPNGGRRPDTRRGHGDARRADGGLRGRPERRRPGLPSPGVGAERVAAEEEQLLAATDRQLAAKDRQLPPPAPNRAVTDEKPGPDPA
jgi:phospholipid N-methyltransferase